MRPRLLVLLLCVGCGRIGPLNGGTGGGSQTASGGGSATGGGTSGTGGGTSGTGGGTAGTGGGTSGTGGGAAVVCAGLDERACSETAGCAVDTCFHCSCVPVFQQCRRVSEAAFDCPQLGCASPLCCNSTTECNAFGGDCAPPGTPWGCGACRIDPGTCTDDTGCNNGQICDPMRCSCNGAMECGAGCTSSADCLDGQVCSGGAHPRCVAKTCNSVSDCDRGFDCTAGSCERRACTSDAQCGGVSCVAGQCYRGLGECRQPVP